ncbi:MAG: hypothetical protein H6982_03370 [Chromatiales bacterium]|nr:hypothetical protein [Chromatiales bacterium]
MAEEPELDFEEEMEAEPWPNDAMEKFRVGQEEFARKDIERLVGAESEEKEFYELPRAALAYLTLNQPSLAAEAANRALQLSSSYTGNWNYGNAIHSCNVVLGLLALDAGERESAISYLRAAGATPGSPQLASFGPNMQLAKRLLLLGEFEEVASYFAQCQRFWKHGGNWLRIWNRKIAAKEVPHFLMHLYV